MSIPSENKGTNLLSFLKDVATLRRKRITAYAPGDKLIWFADVPRDRLECRSAFIAENPAEFPDLWLEVRKKRMPARPSVPEVVKDWVRPRDLELANQEPELLPEITLLIETRVPDPNALPEQGRTVVEKVPEVRCLKDHREVEDAWLEYLVNHWEPWKKEMDRWQEVQRVYEDVDFMRRRLEESEERYELILVVGLLVWRDPTGKTVRRHLLTAPAEISLDAVRGILTVSPAASFEKFRLELDMLEPQDQPRLQKEQQQLDDLLEDLDVKAWEIQRVGEVLRIIANCGPSGAQVDENARKPLERADETFRVVYAPALALRERRPTAYEELINRFLKASESESSPIATTGPWERFLREGEPSGVSAVRPVEDPDNSTGLEEAGCRLYFPLPTNDEQRRIAERLRSRSYVLVKGPPGTGKSHTIANLICHLLASGDRVLVTAHAPKALTVLRELLPADVRSLCVTALGATREDQRLLGDSVGGILGRMDKWKGDKWAQSKIAELENELGQLDDRRAQVERFLRECREAETFSHTLTGGYEGTAAQIARQLEQDKQKFDWLPEVSDDQDACPLGPADIALLAEVHNQLTEERLDELRSDVGNFPLPDLKVFGQAIVKLQAAEKAAEDAGRTVPQEMCDSVRGLSEEVLETSKAFLAVLAESAVRASHLFGKRLAEEILKDLLVGQEAGWNRLAQGVTAMVKAMEAGSEKAGRARVDLPPGVRYQQLLTDARRRMEHFQGGGRRGWGAFASRAVRETRYLEERCRIEGSRPLELESLEKLVAFLELKALVKDFSQAWPAPAAVDHLDPRQAAGRAADLTQELNRLLELFRNRGPDVLVAVPIGERERLAESNERSKWLALIEAESANRLALRAREPLEGWLTSIRSVASGNAHRCIQQTAQAIEERDAEKWKTAWETRELVRAEQQKFRSYQKLVDILEQACPGLKRLFSSGQGDPEWRHRLLQLGRAWAWSAAQAWLHRVSDSDAYRSLREERHRLQDRIERKIEELAALRSWQIFFDRMDDLTEQNLKAWKKAVDRTGKGTGKYAYRHRRTARQYLMTCIPKIPAWIMPLHKLWDTVEARAGLFDTVIVDEASQAGIESLALFLLAKRIVVVGDDKQNSPEAVGVLEDDITRLAHDHLREFRFRDEFRPDTSLFDHAERSFGNVISLREHFRCVPEIIRFSNDLCYTDAPLFPLRQPPPNRLEPLRANFVSAGSCEGEGQRIVDSAEAEKLVEAIQGCLEEEAYEGKTMGVITLQGHAQAELIENKLAKLLEPNLPVSCQPLGRLELRTGVVRHGPFGQIVSFRVEPLHTIVAAIGHMQVPLLVYHQVGGVLDA